MLTVKRRRGSPYFQIVGTVGTQRVRKSTSTTDQRTAEEEAAHLEARLRREQHYGKERETTFGEAALLYIEAKKRDRKPVCSPQYLKVLIKQYGRRTLASFSPGEIRDVAQLLHPDAGNATRNRHGIAPFMAVYNHAVHRKLAPPIVVERFKENPKKSVSIDRLWIDAVRTKMDDAHARALVRLMYETGMRIGTAIALLPGMLDAANNVVRVPGALLKNEDDHNFFVTADLAAELAALPAAKRSHRRNRWSYLHDRDEPPRLFGFRDKSGFYKHLRRACDLAGVPYVPPHQSGRHSFATTYIVDNNIDPVTVAELGGWKDVSMLLKRYPHARETKLRSVVERVSGEGKGQKLKVVK